MGSQALPPGPRDTQVDDTDDSDTDPSDTATTDSADTQGTGTADTGTADTGTTDTGPVITVQVGTGESSFVALAPLDPIEIVAGLQGGYHFLGALRVCNMDAPFDVHFQAIDIASGTLVTDLYYWQWMLIDEGNGCRNTYNMFGYINVALMAYGDQDTAPELLDGHLVELRIEVTDSLGRVESSSVEVNAWSP